MRKLQIRKSQCHTTSKGELLGGTLVKYLYFGVVSITYCVTLSFSNLERGEDLLSVSLLLKFSQ